MEKSYDEYFFTHYFYPSLPQLPPPTVYIRKASLNDPPFIIRIFDHLGFL